jgi:bacterioferritin
MMKIDEFIKDLNSILKVEYGAVMQYIFHSHRVSKLGHGKLAAEILMLGNDEIRHAESLANKIKELGGKPVASAEWDPGQEDLIQMFIINLSSEKESIKVYRKLIKVAKKEGFTGLETLLQEQLADEIRHLKVLQKYLQESNL